ncbi:putative TLD domain protein [Gregarina niphandrodes]|uniref:Oxidation resistance protein 1 n=1 Tax=Gregarina niphandrodes TaxID=110365 RepID=A0A023BCN3_GRENI|nr:putative TLD domain protein [Gregarina niphandrodes]EZG85434.1 putative TLD domain protein [Gregarina niphandrodes]|eukprot:XP_011128830.1 putative TLD domain protein [Gregarina niphandrodes]
MGQALCGRDEAVDTCRSSGALAQVPLSTTTTNATATATPSRPTAAPSGASTVTVTLESGKTVALNGLDTMLALRQNAANTQELMQAVRTIYDDQDTHVFANAGDWSFLPDDLDAVCKLLANLNGFNLDSQVKNRAFPKTPTHRADEPPASQVVSDNQFFLICKGSHAANACTLEAPQLLFSLHQQGESWGRFITCVADYPGPCFLLITLKNEQRVIGAFVKNGLVENGSKYFGTAESYLFGIDTAKGPGNQEALIIRKPTNYESNFVMLNRSSQYMPKGLGFGGDEKDFRILVHADLCTVSTTIACRTYESGSLFGSADTNYTREAKIDNLEVWGFGGAAARQEQAYKQNLQEDLKAERRKVDVARMMGDDTAGMFKKVNPNMGDRAGEVEAIVAEYKEGKKKAPGAS